MVCGRGHGWSYWPTIPFFSGWYISQTTPHYHSIPCTRSSNILSFLTAKVQAADEEMHWAFRNRKLWCLDDDHNNYDVTMTIIVIWPCVARGEICLLMPEFKCHLQFHSSQEVDVFLSHSAVLHYINWSNVDCYLWCHIDGIVQDCSNSIANALELMQSCTKPLIYGGLVAPYIPSSL